MYQEDLYQYGVASLRRLCREIPGRAVGSRGNREATRFFRREVLAANWELFSTEFDAFDWEEHGASLRCGDSDYRVFPSPYSLGCNTTGELVCVSEPDALTRADISGKIVLLHGELAKEPFMPKNFVFYNPEEHRRIIALLEQSAPLAILAAPGKYPAMAGGAYPYPLIEDGDFDIPSVYMREEEGQRLLPCSGRMVSLTSETRRIPGKGYNVVGRKGENSKERLVITAHIDAKKGTPGALDNATGVVVLLLLARLLSDYRGSTCIELAGLNGEDYYAVPGQMVYLRQNQDRFGEILLNINIDGAGYREGATAVSGFGLPDRLQRRVQAMINDFEGLTEGRAWVQGDHSLFVQQGRPALAISSQWLLDHMDTQELTHTPKDDIDLVDCHKLVEIALALGMFIRTF